jgi:hypothetical protein
VPQHAAAVTARSRVVTRFAVHQAASESTRDKAMNDDDPAEADFTQLDDSALLNRRAEMRAELERLPPASPGHAALTVLYDKSTEEVNGRARKAWSAVG